MSLSARRLILVVVVGLATLSVALLPTGPSAASAPPKTLKFTSITQSEKRTEEFSFFSTGVDKAGGKVIGYDVLTGSFDPDTGTARFDVAVALEGGMLYARFKTLADAREYEGRITGGTGDYKGAEGTVSARQKSQKKSLVTFDFD